jgi:hypothetical protein
MKVDHKYKKKEVILLDVALRSVGIGLPFSMVDLVHETLKVLEEKGDQMALSDSCKLQADNKEKWMRYEIETAQDPRTTGNDLRT